MIDEAIREIEGMDTHSASVVAVKAAEALRELTEREYHTVEEFRRDLERNSAAMQRANLSHAPLHTTQQRIVAEIAEEEFDDLAAAKERLSAVVDEVVEGARSSKERAARRAADMISDGDVLLTHECSTTVLATLRTALDDGTEFDLYVTESRPRFLGRRTARRLGGAAGVDVTLIVEGAVGHYLDDCDRVFLGMNCLIEDTLYNRVGTYPIALAAQDHDVPVTVVASSSKFIGTGFEFRNEHRSPSEVMLEPAEGFDVGNPAYDATPTRLLDTVVTEEATLQF